MHEHCVVLFVTIFSWKVTHAIGEKSTNIFSHGEVVVSWFLFIFYHAWTQCIQIPLCTCKAKWSIMQATSFSSSHNHATCTCITATQREVVSVAQCHCVGVGVQCAGAGGIQGKTNGCHERGSRREWGRHLKSRVIDCYNYYNWQQIKLSTPKLTVYHWQVLMMT